MLVAIKDQIKTLKSPLDPKDTPKPPDPTNVVLTNRKDPSLDGGQSTKNGGMWNMKHEIIS